MYITSIKIKNLRCFEEAELTFQYPGREQPDPPRLPNVNLLLGNNGSGKSTVLKAIAMSMLSPVVQQSGFVSYRLVRRIATEEIASKGRQKSKPNLDELKESDAIVRAEVLIHEQDLGQYITKNRSPLLIVEIRRNRDFESLLSGNEGDGPPLPFGYWEQMYNDTSPAFLVVGYSASRRVEDSEKLDLTARRKARLLRYERVAGLFENYVSLIPLAAWLPNFRKENPGRHKQVVNLINRLLPEGASFAGEFEQGEYLFEINGTKAPFGALSDGYRAYIGWIADLLYHICMGAPKGAKLVDNRGIILVDEIDLHLHPEWQRSVIATISETLPNLQFVFTTHSPIVAGSVNKENIFVMETTSDGASVVRQYDERIYGLNAEQVLLSSYFNLKTTRATPFVDELHTLTLQAGKGDLNAALAFMEKLSGEESPPTATALVKDRTKPASTGKRAKKSSAVVKAKRKR